MTDYANLHDFFMKKFKHDNSLHIHWAKLKLNWYKKSLCSHFKNVC
jgi:hypothetical protein